MKNQKPLFFQSHFQTKKVSLDVLALEREGKLFLKEKQFHKAEAVFSRLIDCGDAYWVYLGKSLFGQKKYKSAKECYEKVICRAGSGVDWAYDLFKYLGLCFYYLGDLESALENLNKAQSFYRNKFDGDLCLGYGLIFKDQKNYQEAKKKFQLILEKDSHHADAWAGLAEIRACEGDFELAYHSVMQALDLEPRNEQALKTKIRWSSHFQETLGMKQLFHFNI